MGNAHKHKAEAVKSAARIFHEDQPRPRTAAEVCEEGDDPEALAMEAWAEEMVRRGVGRQVALQCAAAIWELQRAKDAACAGAVLYAGPVPEAAPVQLLEGLLAVAVKFKQAPNPKFSAGCLEIATGQTGLSARAWADEQGKSHQLAAAEVREWQLVLGLPRLSGQKSPEACESYRATNKNRSNYEL